MKYHDTHDAAPPAVSGTNGTRARGSHAGRRPPAILQRQSGNEPRRLTDSELHVPGRVLIKRRQLLQKVPLCERTILDLEKRGKFPRRFSITSRLVAWDLKEIDTWIEEQQITAHRPLPPMSGRR